MPHVCVPVRYWIAALLCCPATTAYAEEEAQRPGPWHIGVGAVALDQPYAGSDTEVNGFPVVGYLGERLQVFGPRANYLLLGNETFSLKADASLRFSSYEPEDSEALQGMDERDMTLEAGFTVSAKGTLGEVDLSLLTDVLDRHSGQEAVLRYGYEIGAESLTVTPFAGLRWISSNLADYYYGVRPEEATPVRPEYSAPSATSPFVGVSARYRLTSRWSLFGMVVSYRLADGSRESPIVEDDTSTTLLLTVTRNL
jgi:MipA family protein